MTAWSIFKRVYRILLFLAITLFYNVLVSKIWTDYLSKPLTFTVDTNFLNFTTTFPAVSICEIYNAEKMWELTEEIYGAERNKYFDDVMTDVTFFSGLCYSCKKCENNQEFCSNFDLANITKTFRTGCPKLLLNCQWNGEPFDCCEGFLELRSEVGVCYTINSMHTEPQFGKKLISNRESGPGILELIAMEDVELYLHSTEDIPSKNSDRNLRETILWGVQKEILFGVQEIINEENVQDTTIAQRRCQFNWEVVNTTYPIFDYYSYSTCMVRCNFEIQLATCGCVHHLMPMGRTENVPVCGFEGLICLTDQYDTINERRRKECRCLSSCTEQEINIVYSSNDLSFHDIGTKLTLQMISLPKMRYIRKTVRSLLDFIISLGGVLGLLYGASFLTIIEVIFKAYKRVIGRH